MKPEEFKRIRTKFELSQEQLAAVLGLSGRKVISHFESGVRNPSKLAAAFLRLLDNIPRKKAHALMGLLQKYMEK